MRRWFLILMPGAIAFAALASVRAQQPDAGAGGRSVWDGVYTAAQAKRGGDVYAEHCLECHGETLQGDGTASALAGPGFKDDFNGVKLGEMLDRTRKTMPDDKPGTMSRQQIADFLAYVFSVNKFPAGEAELPTQAEVLNQITFLATKPTGKVSELIRRMP